MLGKLIKHEWKATWKIPTLVIGILLIATILCSLVFCLPVWKSSMEGLDFLSIMVFLLYYMILITSSLAITFLMFSRFYKSMFTDEGYLTHTLPVTPRQLLVAKGLVMAFWYLASTVSILASMLIFAMNGVNFLHPEGKTFPILMAEFIAELNSETNGEITKLFSVLIIFFILSLVSNVGVTIGSVCFGQMVNRHKILGTISAYLVIYFIMQILMTIALFPFMVDAMVYGSSDAHVMAVLTPFYYIASFIAVAVGTVLFFLSERIIKRKINLD